MSESSERTFRIPADAAWQSNGEFTHTATTEVGMEYVVEAARLLVAVSRLNGMSVQGLILMALRYEGRQPVPGEAAQTPIDPLS